MRNSTKSDRSQQRTVDFLVGLLASVLHAASYTKLARFARRGDSRLSATRDTPRSVGSARGRRFAGAPLATCEFSLQDSESKTRLRARQRAADDRGVLRAAMLPHNVSDAIFEHNWDSVEQWFRLVGPDRVNDRNHDGSPALKLLCCTSIDEGCVRFARFLIDQGADVHLCCNEPNYGAEGSWKAYARRCAGITKGASLTA